MPAAAMPAAAMPAAAVETASSMPKPRRRRRFSRSEDGPRRLSAAIPAIIAFEMVFRISTSCC